MICAYRLTVVDQLEMWAEKRFAHRRRLDTLINSDDFSAVYFAMDFLFFVLYIQSWL